MAQPLEGQNFDGPDLQHYLGIVRRRHLHFLLPMLLGWLAVWLVSWVLPAQYKSGTLILVEQPTMPKDYVVPNISDDLQARLQSITQQILSRTRLLHIIDQLNVYPHAELTPDEKVERMRKDIEIELVRNEQNRAVTAFNIYYSSHDPHIAQQVTSEITNLFINENLEVRQQESEGTTRFLANQLDAARQALAGQEEKIRQFKGHYVGELPTQLGSNLQILSGLQSQLQNEEDALNTAKQQHVYLQTMLDHYHTLRGTTTSAEGGPMGLPAIDQELEKLKNELAGLEARSYTDHHPDVRKLKEQIVLTEKMRDKLLNDPKTKKDNAQPGVNDTAVAHDATDLAQSSPMAQLQSQLQANQIEINNREQAVTALKAKINDYQARLNQEPVREQQLADLTRGYDQSKANYDELLKKKNESTMATSMELLQQGQRFRIIDPPSLPLKPEFPNRLKFCGIGLAVGLVLGAGVVGAFEMIDDRVYSEKKIKDLLPVPVISEIPVILNQSDERDAKKRVWLGWATGALVFATILVGSAFSYFRG